MRGKPSLKKIGLAAAREGRRGAAIVEFVIVFTLLFFLLFAMIETGQYINVHQVVNNASREGARRAALQTATTNNVTTTVRNYLRVAGIPENAVTNAVIEIDPTDFTDLDTRDPVTVNVTVNFADLNWMPLNWAFSMISTDGESIANRDPNLLPITGTTTMRRE